MDGLREIENKKRSYYAEVVKQANELPIEITNTTGTYLQHLNEDCLLEIFSVKSLDLLDLCSLAKTCTSFQHITKRVFPKDLRIIISGNDYWFKTKNDFTSKRDDIERIFKNFGSIVNEISIESNPLDPFEISSLLFLLNLLMKYCVNTLKVLSIHYIKITEVLTVKFEAIFKRLQKLNLNYVGIEEDKTLFADCGSLIELSVDSVKNCSALLENTFPKLERLTYIQTAEPTKQLLPSFISRHPSLKMLSLHFYMKIENESFKNVVEEIGNSCKELEELSICMWHDIPVSIQALQAVKSQKTLKLWSRSWNDFEFMSALTNLRELHLVACRLPKDLNQFAFLTQLTKLHFIYTELGSFDAVEIIRRLKNLEEISIMGCHGFVLDENTFSKIVAVTRGRPKVLTLKCGFNLKNCDVNQKFPAMRALSMSSADAFILVYDVTDSSTFDEARVIRDQIHETKATTAVPIVVVGNKIDLLEDKPDSRELEFDTTESLVNVDWENGFVEASAKNNENVTQIFKELLVQAKITYNLSPALRRRRRQSLPPNQGGSPAPPSSAPPSTSHVPSAAQLQHLQQIQERSIGGKRNSCILS